MTDLIAAFRGFDRPSRVLMVDQFAINIGFYMLMPYWPGRSGWPRGRWGWCSASAISPSKACSCSAAHWPIGSATNRSS